MQKTRLLMLVLTILAMVSSWSAGGFRTAHGDVDPTMTALETQIAELQATGTALAVAQTTPTSTPIPDDGPTIRPPLREIEEPRAEPSATETALSPTTISHPACDSPEFSLQPIDLTVLTAHARVMSGVPGAVEPSRPYLVIALEVQSGSRYEIVPPIETSFARWEIIDQSGSPGYFNPELSLQATSVELGREELQIKPEEAVTIVLVFEISQEPSGVWLRNPLLKDRVLAADGYEICLTPPGEDFVYPEVTPTIAATATATVAPTRTATPRSTATPRRTPTSVSRSSSSYPTNVQRIVSDDHPTRCDEIGWNVSDGELEGALERDGNHYIACGGAQVIVTCFSVKDTGGLWSPASGYKWVLCWAVVFNSGRDSIIVSPFDFTLIDANNRRYSTSFEPLLMFEFSEMFPTDTVPSGQGVAGMVGFVVPTSASNPLRLEVQPDFGFGDTLIIILDPMLQG